MTLCEPDSRVSLDAAPGGGGSPPVLADMLPGGLPAGWQPAADPNDQRFPDQAGGGKGVRGD